MPAQAESGLLRSIGRWDLVAELNTESLAEFSRTLDQIRMIEGIASTETSILLATQKF